MEFEVQAKRDKKIGYVYIVIASSCYAMIGIFGKLVLNAGFSAFELLFYQYVVMTILIGGFLLIKSPRDLRISKQMLIFLLIQGVVGTTGTSVLYYLAIEKINVGMASMLLFTYPIFVNLFFIFSGIRKINLGSKIALASAFVGSCLVLNIFTTGIAGMSVAGIVLGILSSFCYAFFNVFADLKLNTLKPIVISFYTSLTTLIIGGVLAPGALPHFADITGLASGLGLTPELLTMLGYLAMLALICGVLPTILMYEGIARIGADKASVLASSELPLTVIFAYFVLGEQMVLIQILGIVLIVVALLMLHRSDQGGNHYEIK